MKLESNAESLLLQYRLMDEPDWHEISCSGNAEDLRSQADFFRSGLDYKDKLSIEFRMIDEEGRIRFHADGDKHWSLPWRLVN